MFNKIKKYISDNTGFLIRLDDIAENMNWNMMEQVTNLLDKFGTNISKLTLIPSSGGVYEVIKNDQIIFSKKELNRFPELDEIITLIES